MRTRAECCLAAASNAMVGPAQPPVFVFAAPMPAALVRGASAVLKSHRAARMRGGTRVRGDRDNDNHRNREAW